MLLSIRSSAGADDQTFGKPYKNAVNIYCIQIISLQGVPRALLENHQHFLFGVKLERMVIHSEHLVKLIV